MKCPLCEGQLSKRHRSIAEADRDVYFCSGCPMVYMLLRDHEEDYIRKSREMIQVFGGRPAFPAA